MTTPVPPAPVGVESLEAAPTKTRRAARVFRSIVAVIAGALTGIVLSIGTDAALVAAGVFPPLSKPDSFTSPLLILATVHRNLYGVAGSYLTARLAPNHPMGHALFLGVLGLAANIAGTVTMWGVGPAWYPLTLTALAMPAAWAGGKLRVMQLAR
jgi:hypothetical protein